MERRQIASMPLGAALAAGAASVIGGTINHLVVLQVAGGVAVFCGLAGLAYLFLTAPKKPSHIVPPSATVFSENQSGGVTAHTINIGSYDE